MDGHVPGEYVAAGYQIFLLSSAVEQSAVNRSVVCSNQTGGAKNKDFEKSESLFLYPNQSDSEVWHIIKGAIRHIELKHICFESKYPIDGVAYNLCAIALLANEKRYEAYQFEQQALRIMDEEVIYAK